MNYAFSWKIKHYMREILRLHQEIITCICSLRQLKKIIIEYIEEITSYLKRTEKSLNQDLNVT